MLMIPFLILLFFLGLEITIVLRTRMEIPERLSVSYLLGIGVLTFFVFLTDFIFNLNFSLINTFLILIFLCSVLFVFGYKNIMSFFKDIKFERPVFKLNKKTFFWIFILSIFIYTLLVNWFWPVFDWDALALYDFRAKVFLVDANLIRATLDNGYFMGYPLLTSLAHLFVYQMGLNNPKFIYSLFYLSFVIIFYYSLKKNVSESKAMLFAVILALMPEILSNATVAYTNLAYVVYLCSGTLYLYDWIKNKERSYLLLSAILVALSTWIRIAEPFWLVPFFVVSLISIKEKEWKNIIYYFISILIFYLPWRLFESYINKMGVPALSVGQLNYVNSLKYIDLERIFLVLNYLYTYVFSTWGLIFLAFMFMIIGVILYRKRRDNQFLYITLLFFALLFAGTLIFSITFPEWKDIPDSARRMSMFLLPLMLYSIGLNI